MDGESPRLATTDDRERVLSTVVAAFVDDPAFGFFFPDRERYPAEAAALAGDLFDQRVARGTVWVVAGGSGVAMWDGPTTSAPATDSAGSHPTPPTDEGDVAPMDAYHAAVQAALPEQPYWYLGVLATHPDNAGRGYGRTLMAAGLGRARADGLAAYLETTNDANVGWYEALGWSVAVRCPVGPLDIRVMRHPGGS